MGTRDESTVNKATVGSMCRKRGCQPMGERERMHLHGRIDRLQTLLQVVVTICFMLLVCVAILHLQGVQLYKNLELERARAESYSLLAESYRKALYEKPDNTRLMEE